jgi:DNA-binding GntR family transcriptional regulator
MTSATPAALGTFRRLADRIAARLAGHLQGARPWTPVAADRELTARLDVSPSTAGAAKRALAALGLIVKSNGSYYVAPPPKTGGS